MRTIQVKVFKFSELSERAKERAKSDYASVFGYAWSSDAINTLQTLAKRFHGKLVQYEIDFFGCFHCSAKFDMESGWNLTEEEIGDIIAGLGSVQDDGIRGNGDCVLTGVWTDEDACDGLRQAWSNGERDLNRLMQAGFESLVRACVSDCEYQYKDEVFSEHSDANGYEYYEDGEML